MSRKKPQEVAGLRTQKEVLARALFLGCTVLEDNNYKELITFYYPQILRKYSEVTDNQLLWELIKMELR